MAKINVKHEEQKQVSFIRPVLLATGFSLLLLLLLTLLFAALFAAFEIPTYVLTPIAVFSQTVAAFAGGFFVARLARAKGLPLGLAVGGTFFALLFVLCLIFVRGGMGVFLLAKLLLVLAGAATGGVIGVNLTAKRK